MPTGLGFHPYFADYEKLILEFKTALYQLVNDNILVSAALLENDIVLGMPTTVSTFQVDNCLNEISEDPIISWTDRDYSLLVSRSETLNYMVLYSNAKSHSFCLEAASHFDKCDQFLWAKYALWNPRPWPLSLIHISEPTRPY